MILFQTHDKPGVGVVGLPSIELARAGTRSSLHFVRRMNTTASCRVSKSFVGPITSVRWCRSRSAFRYDSTCANAQCTPCRVVNSRDRPRIHDEPLDWYRRLANKLADFL